MGTHRDGRLHSVRNEIDREDPLPSRVEYPEHLLRSREGVTARDRKLLALVE
jgi:hypothetical protein